MPTESSAVVNASKLTKTYGQLTAVNGVDFHIDAGEIFGLIGPDGAGKTTIFHMLGGILQPTSGELAVLSMSAHDARLRIGYLTQQFSLYPDLSIDQNLNYASGLRSVPPDELAQRKRKYLELMDLKRFENRLAGDLSGGMKQKLALCCALISRPRLLLLDEPTTGVDPVSRRDFWDVLNSIADEGVTIAVATPYLDEAERCTRIALIHKGTIRKTGTPAQLKEQLGLSRLELRAGSLNDLTRLIETCEKDPQTRAAIADVQEFGDRLDVLVSNLDEAQIKLKQAAVADNIDLSISLQPATLENVFALTIKQSEPPPAQVVFPFVEQGSGGTTAIKATNLSKRFGSFDAVKAVNIQIDYGEIYGLLGANGAGKTTTIKMLCGLLRKTSGDMVLGGQAHDLRDPRLRQKIGYMSQKFSLYDDLTVLENLSFYGGVYQVPADLMAERIDWVLKTCNLSGSENMLTGQLPGGFRQRLAFGATVLHQPEILFLDEPTSGVDPLARRQLWSLISEFARQGTAVLVTTHFLEEAEHCHKLGFMAAGTLVASGSPYDIKESQPGKLIELRTANNQDALHELRKSIVRWQVSIFGDAVHVVAESPAQEQLIGDILKRAQISVIAQRNIPFSLEDAFIGIVERSKLQEQVA